MEQINTEYIDYFIAVDTLTLVQMHVQHCVLQQNVNALVVIIIYG